MIATATIRVRPPANVSGQRPARERMERAAELLRQSGFEVLRIGRFGVNVKGDETAFQRELGVDLGQAASIVEAPRPHLKELSQLIDLVEIAAPPLSFP